MRRGIRAALIVALALPAAPHPAPGAPEAAAQRQLLQQDRSEKLIALLEADLFLAAAEYADGLLGRAPLNPLTEALCGLAVLKVGRVDEAEAILKRVKARRAILPEAALGLGRLALIRNDSEAAMPLLREALESRALYPEAGRQLWRAAMAGGSLVEINAARAAIMIRYVRQGEPAPAWLMSGSLQIEGYRGPGLFRLEAAPESVSVPLRLDAARSPRMIAMRLNGRGEYPIDIDSASADFLTISPLLAEELGLNPTGSATATGVGSGTAAVRFSRLDRVEFGGIVFRDVPVMVSDLHVFRGLRKGLLGTALLKRFNVTIDARAGTVDFSALDRPDLLAGRIDRARMAADVPLLVFDATMVTASLEGTPEALYILDSAAATNLIDAPFFSRHLKPRLDPARIVAAGIQGATGVQTVNQVNGLKVRLGPLLYDGQQVNEFPMSALNSISERYAAGLLGNPLLWPYRCHFDFRNGRLILERYK